MAIWCGRLFEHDCRTSNDTREPLELSGAYPFRKTGIHFSGICASRQPQDNTCRGKERIVSYSSAIRAAGLFAVLGALSGLVCAYTPIVEALNISLGWTGLFSSSATVPPLPGVV